MKDRDNLNAISSETVHDPVTALDDLAEGLIANLRDNPSGARGGFKSGAAAKIRSTRRSPY